MPVSIATGMSFMSYIQGEARNQGRLFPLSLNELIPEDHPCRRARTTPVAETGDGPCHALPRQPGTAR
ncbi:hypothetical protein APA46_30375 [Pseudomonas aeruginosa]|nr:hypothetical protein [Pseudomonas aeruginosa]OPE05842.1 hypothetical protein APA46_30375 [Pseudomonas aeruginosa]PBY24598.1 hypothetical protein CJT61_01845 [Pseudomonas aeruginosa]PCB91955.1 hypothetical protein CJT62_11280 [Pseudomonas aeruginosa]RPZ34279.1 hypothetical protein IPC563_09860 [Pseudomonas aeruginosa]